MATNLKTQLPKYFEITPGYHKLRVGHITDSIIIVDEPKYDCYILAGISQNQIFSKVLMKNMDINKGILYDINIPNNIINYPDNTNIIKKNVGYILDKDLNKSNTSDLREIIQQYDNVFLKMDIHGDEYVWLLSLPDNALNSFKQMVITFNDVNYNPTKTRAINKIKCFNKIIETHNIAHTQYKGINENKSKLIITYIRKDVICKNKVDTNVVQDEKQLEAEEAQKQLEAERIIKQQAEEEQRLLEAEEAQKQIEAEEAQKESETHNVVPNNQEDFKKMADDKEAEELRKKLEAEELLIQEEKAKQIAKKIEDDKEAEELRKKLEAEQLAND